MKTQRVEVRMSKELENKVKLKAKILNVSVSAYIRMVLSEPEE